MKNVEQQETIKDLFLKLAEKLDINEYHFIANGQQNNFDCFDDGTLQTYYVMEDSLGVAFLQELRLVGIKPRAASIEEQIGNYPDFGESSAYDIVLPCNQDTINKLDTALNGSPEQKKQLSLLRIEENIRQQMMSNANTLTHHGFTPEQARKEIAQIASRARRELLSQKL